MIFKIEREGIIVNIWSFIKSRKILENLVFRIENTFSGSDFLHNLLKVLGK